MTFLLTTIYEGVISQTYRNTTDLQGTDGAVPAAGGDNEIYDFNSDDGLSDLEEDEKYEAGEETLQLEINSAPEAVYDGDVRDEDEGRKSDSPERVFAMDGKKVPGGFIHGQVGRSRASQGYRSKACRRYHDLVHVAYCGALWPTYWSGSAVDRSVSQWLEVGENTDAEQQSLV
ncbi:hypothetical protein BDK51DRAFT_34052 [Blyttiomyces helicus]|uniref:Uncharacterized protein n=1 Tax=Blyttiomyces helicus TaxID=388810 RepID=A0A4P9WNB6_9FUNG|nr:hypothetical protein BDK51DRAFT_34052 [Blyttiomyces helicus]|eukprot:RKO93563.1 hypothetical protein BDK51DRAFT_34052 [Blyttiomyces helicus]